MPNSSNLNICSHWVSLRSWRFNRGTTSLSDELRRFSSRSTSMSSLSLLSEEFELVSSSRITDTTSFKSCLKSSVWEMELVSWRLIAVQTTNDKRYFKKRKHWRIEAHITNILTYIQIKMTGYLPYSSRYIGIYYFVCRETNVKLNVSVDMKSQTWNA
jgi:hypothetical protein